MRLHFYFTKNNNFKVIDERIEVSYNKHRKGKVLGTVFFYKDRGGREPVLDYIYHLSKKNDKDSRIKLNKINDYIEMLQRYGTMVGEPYMKHLDGPIWELRPLKDRILFAGYTGDTYVLLHTFVKKTPKREIEQAKREIKDFLERNENNEE